MLSGRIVGAVRVVAIAAAAACGARTTGGLDDGALPGTGSGSSGGGSSGTVGRSSGASGSSSGGFGSSSGGSSGGFGSSSSSGSSGGSGSSSSSGSSGSSGSGSSSSSSSSGGVDGGIVCQGLAANEELVDNMNDGSQFIPNIHGRAGAWQVEHDTTPGATMFPPDGTFPMSDTGDPCRLLAARAYGGQFVLWGSSFLVGLGGPYNASPYKGISFWAKVGPSSTNFLRVAFPDKDTDPAGGLCSTAPGALNGCYDHFGKSIMLSTTWTKVTIRFTDLTQQAFGNLVAQFDPSTLFRIEWDIFPGATFDIWVDDLALLTQ